MRLCSEWALKTGEEIQKLFDICDAVCGAALQLCEAQRRRDGSHYDSSRPSSHILSSARYVSLQALVLHLHTATQKMLL